MTLELNGIRVERASKHFGATVALEAVSLEFAPGTIAAVIGANGCGKSTLLSVMTGALRADTGDVYLGANRVTETTQIQRARMGVFRTYQDPGQLPPLSLRRISEAAARRGRVSKLAKSTATLPFALDRNGDELTPGQRKLFIVSLAFANGASVCLFDEPCAGLDHTSRRAVAEMLNELARRGSTIILVEHDMEFVRGCAARAHLLRRGELVASGATDAVIAKYEEMKRAVAA